jgi:hypothetical protein
LQPAAASNASSGNGQIHLTIDKGFAKTDSSQGRAARQAALFDIGSVEPG